MAYSTTLEITARVCICTIQRIYSISFLIPTHQVDALNIDPAGYNAPDFMKAGCIMIILFLVVKMILMNLAL